MFERVKINLPAVVVYQFVRHEFHILQLRQKLEKRIARHWHKHLVSGIAEKTEAIRVSLAGADRQYERIGREWSFILPIVFADALPCGEKAFCRRFVA